ncbi:diguanylate cyclase [Lentzea albidocapillata]|uniref:diguanylate cyclase n=1 Tax=Lentzea albidocapillata TaxID=40571 RepID=UPI000B7D2C73|nr:diguanylate cyclase [Lentzea albidocapillata]
MTAPTTATATSSRPCETPPRQCASCGQPHGSWDRDRLTGLLNRWGWDVHAPHALDEAIRRGRPVTLLIIDLDHFKPVNDEFGHPAGDAVLRATAQVLRDAVRDSDLVGRFGGDEFVVLVPGADTERAFAVGRRIHADIAAISLAPAAATGINAGLSGFSASIGITVHAPGADDVDVDKLLFEADAALRRAKRVGRNTIRIASPALDTELDDPDELHSKSGSSRHDYVPLQRPTPCMTCRTVVPAREPTYWFGLYKLLQLLKGEWVPAILGALADGPQHFCEILATIHNTAIGQPDSDRWLHDSILTRTLRSMEDKKLVVRHEQPARFPKSTMYELTPLAATLLAVLAPAVQWGSTRDAHGHSADTTGTRGTDELPLRSAV